ncbi:MAG: sugar phosphate nucleotidyltransferase [Mucinivorans sp.]
MNNNYCVIMAGGVGSRFWPMSTQSQPKQFLDPLGLGKSFIRSTFERFLPIVPPENFLVVTSVQYLDQVLQHLPEIKASQILLEPVRRNTAPCIAYASHRILSVNPAARIVVTPSDHLVTSEQEFQNIINQGLDFVDHSNNLLTIGITPKHPETGYGYIQFQEGEQEFKKVKTFTEKPNTDLAKVFVQSGDFLWNSGIFIWSVQGIINALNSFLPDLNSQFAAAEQVWGTTKEQAFIDELYPQCDNISIDYGLMEKASDVYVRAGNFGWSDIGTWGSLASYAPKDKQGNILHGGVMAYDTNNSLISVPKGKVAVVSGLEGYMVVQTHDKLLICPLEQEQNIRNWVEDIKAQWGEQFL